MSATVTSRLNTTLLNLRDQSPEQLSTTFAGWVDVPDKKQRGEKKLRHRVYDYQTTYWLFLWQMMAGGVACEDATAMMISWLAFEQEKLAYPDNSAYCQARMNLDLETIQSNCLEVARCLQNEVCDPWRLWLSRQTVIVDGSSLQMMDTPTNQRDYPQPSGQTEGCGFPVMRLMVMFSLETGAILGYERSSLQVSEHELFRRLWPQLKPGQVVLGDAGFCSYGEIWRLKDKHQVECVMANNPTRTANVRKVEKLGEGDYLVEWTNDGYRPEWMDDETWAKCPPSMLLRQITSRVKIPKCRKKKIEIITTMLNSTECPKSAFVELFRRRWLAELFLRDIKTTMGMEEIRCKTPAMVHKALAMYILAYNLIRVMIYTASCEYPIRATALSFKRSLRLIQSFSPYLARISDQEKYERVVDILLYYIAHRVVGDRPGRYEPRAVKRRPKNYQRLTAPRRKFVEIAHRNRYYKQSEKA